MQKQRVMLKESKAAPALQPRKMNKHLTCCPIKPAGPRSDSRRHRVGLSVCLRFPTSGLGPMLLADDSRPGPASAPSA